MLRRVALALALSAALTGCGALGGGEPGGEEEHPAPGGKVEKPKIKVALISTIDLAPLYLADKKGYFKEEGLELEIVTLPSSQVTLTSLISGQADFAFASYVPFFVAQDKKAADIKIVADSVSASPRSNMIVTKPGSAVKSVRDLAGKKIGVSALNTASHIMSMAAMKANDVDQREVKWTPIPFPDMAAALSRGDVDAAYLPEPFITQAAKTIGAVPIADVATGPTEDFPIAGYGALAKFAAGNPKTVTAFQHAMKKATDESADRAAIQPYVVEFGKVDQDTAALVTLPNFHSTLDARRLQRVPDQLLEFHVIGNRIDVGPMLAPQG